MVPNVISSRINVFKFLKVINEDQNSAFTTNGFSERSRYSKESAAAPNEDGSSLILFKPSWRDLRLESSKTPGNCSSKLLDMSGE